jgi:hypothetical protein
MVSACHPPVETDTEVTLFTKGISRPFTCSTSSGTLESSADIDRLCFPFIDLYAPSPTPWFHSSESPSTKTLHFVHEKRNNLLNNVKNSNSDNLYSRPECHVGSKDFSISKNIAAVGIYCWNLGCDPPASYTEVSYCELLEGRTDLQLVSFFPQCVFGLFLKSASNIVMDMRLIGRKFWAIARCQQSYDFCLLPSRREVPKQKAVIE